MDDDIHAFLNKDLCVLHDSGRIVVVTKFYVFPSTLLGQRAGNVTLSLHPLAARISTHSHADLELVLGFGQANGPAQYSCSECGDHDCPFNFAHHLPPSCSLFLDRSNPRSRGDYCELFLLITLNGASNQTNDLGDLSVIDPARRN